MKTAGKVTEKKKPDEAYKNILALPETGETSLSKNKNYKASVSIGMSLSCMHPVMRVCDNGAAPNLITADVMDKSWLHNVRQHDMPEIESDSNTNQVVSGTINLHPRIGESLMRV